MSDYFFSSHTHTLPLFYNRFLGSGAYIYENNSKIFTKKTHFKAAAKVVPEHSCTWLPHQNQSLYSLHSSVTIFNMEKNEKI